MSKMAEMAQTIEELRTAAGYDYSAVQAKVNALVKKQETTLSTTP